MQSPLATHQSPDMCVLAPVILLLLYSLQGDVVTANNDKASNDFKGAPENLTSIWESNSITIWSTRVKYTRELADHCFSMVMMLKTMNASTWQFNLTSTRCNNEGESRKCSFKKPSLDDEKCYEMQVRFQINKVCLSKQPFSNWSRTVIVKNGSLSDSCPEIENKRLRETHSEFQWLVIILFSVLLSVAFFSVIILGCVIKRVKKLLPIVPDPKNKFPMLYDHHSRYLQEWMKISKYNVQLEEIESVLEEQDGEEDSKYKKKNESTILENQYVMEEPLGNVTAGPFMEGVSDTNFANINFTMKDNAYIML